MWNERVPWKSRRESDMTEMKENVREKKWKKKKVIELKWEKMRWVRVAKREIDMYQVRRMIEKLVSCENRMEKVRQEGIGERERRNRNRIWVKLKWDRMEKKEWNERVRWGHWNWESEINE